ncbi:MAG: SUMF1/EgtB/PvdO family nonheme iron enzyme [Planctomycetota bacterium]
MLRGGRDAIAPRSARRFEVVLARDATELDLEATSVDGVKTRLHAAVERVAVPAWVAELSADERPPVPLPAGLVFDHEPRRYQSAATGAPFVFAPGARVPAPVGRRVRSFFIARHETTNREFEQFARAEKWRTHAEHSGKGLAFLSGDAQPRDHHVSWRHPGARPALPDEPVVLVAWTDADEYARWAGMALPSEDQWLRAALWEGTRWRRFPWGDDPPVAGGRPCVNLADMAWKRHFPSAGTPAFGANDDGFALVAPVGSFPDSPSPVGALDLGGNVSEWCSDEKPGGRVVRGGGWRHAPLNATKDGGVLAPPTFAADDLGFRLACPAE